MSGHSKWNNIKRKKEKTDGAKAKVFTKIGREISVAVRTGGPNPASNSKLADLISKAKRMSVPNDNIQRIIKKAEGGDKTEYEAITYEGYGPGGVAATVPLRTCATTLIRTAATWVLWAAWASCSARKASSTSPSRTRMPTRP